MTIAAPSAMSSGPHPTYAAPGPCPLCGASLRPLLTSWFCPQEADHPVVAQTHSVTHPASSAAVAAYGAQAGHVRYTSALLRAGASGVGELELHAAGHCLPWTNAVLAGRVFEVDPYGVNRHRLHAVVRGQGPLQNGGPARLELWAECPASPSHACSWPSTWIYTGLSVGLPSSGTATAVMRDLDLPVVGPSPGRPPAHPSAVTYDRVELELRPSIAPGVPVVRARFDLGPCMWYLSIPLAGPTPPRPTDLTGIGGGVHGLVMHDHPAYANGAWELHADRGGPTGPANYTTTGIVVHHAIPSTFSNVSLPTV